MKEFNPYAAPLADISASHSPDEVGVWRDGVLLVMSKDAELPDRCLKCNAPAQGWRLKRKLNWHPLGYYLIVLFNLIIYLIVALIVRHTAKVEVPLCPVHRRRRRRQIATAWALCLLGPVVMIAAGSAEAGLRSALGQERATTVIVSLVITGVVMLIAGLILAIVASNVVSPQKIDKRFVWLKKVSPELLAGLPTW